MKKTLKNTLATLAANLRECAGVDAEYVCIPEGYRQECIKINGVSFFWDRKGMYDGWEVTLTGWDDDMERLIDGQEPSAEFTEFLRVNPHLKRGVMAVVEAEHVERKETPDGDRLMIVRRLTS